MSTETRGRLLDAGWTIQCERRIEVNLLGESKSVERVATWRAVKGTDEIVVQAGLGQDAAAFLELYKAAKSIDPDLQQIAMDAGSGAWVIDLSEAAAELGHHDH